MLRRIKMDRIILQNKIRNLDEQFAVLQRHMRVNSIQTRREYSVIFKKFYRWVVEAGKYWSETSSCIYNLRAG